MVMILFMSIILVQKSLYEHSDPQIFYRNRHLII